MFVFLPRVANLLLYHFKSHFHCELKSHFLVGLLINLRGELVKSRFLSNIVRRGVR